MQMGQLLCGVLFGTLTAAACLATELSVTTAVMAYVVGGNVGLLASLLNGNSFET